jgi:hypothetical protein
LLDPGAKEHSFGKYKVLCLKIGQQLKQAQKKSNWAKEDYSHIQDVPIVVRA